ncbi:hypothetical protein [Actinomadura rupiterrae]|uniref:hypothetical protein n=1 Tax=Actinomadura rupiterrae TaxID=559627 RepID=UPI0020A4076E|nr:hypothetical protein [Actinomadura rupiterrae]MCP2338029.1 5-hydroxyisourate hydrolase-like protein (transthyretin family) [Actinomadura rupiterrae]
MRRFLSLLCAALAALTLLAAPPAYAGGPPTIRPPNWQPRNVGDTIDAEADISWPGPLPRSINARLWMSGSGETIADVELAPSRIGNLYWQGPQPVRLPRSGQVMVDYRIVDADGSSRTQTNPYVRVYRHVRFSELAHTPEPADPQHRQVTITSRVLGVGEDGSTAPLTGTTVGLFLRGVDETKPIATATTDADGRVSFTAEGADPDGGGWWPDRDFYLGVSTDDYWDTSELITVHYVRPKSRITLDAPTFPQPVRSGTVVTLTGRLEFQAANGNWTPGSGPVTLTECDHKAFCANTVASANARDGRFSLGVTAQATQGGYEARFSGTVEIGPSYSEELPLDVRYVTAFRGVSVSPRPVVAGKNAVISAQWACVGSASCDTRRDGLISQPLVLEARTGATWRVIATGSTSPDRVALTAPAARGAVWRLRALAAPGYLAAVGPEIKVDARYVSGFDHVSLPSKVKKRHALRVGGRLMRQVGKTWKPVTGATVQVCFRQAGAKGTTFCHSARTDRYGRFVRTEYPQRSGSWWFAYAGTEANGDFSAKTAEKYVRVS